MTINRRRFLATTAGTGSFLGLAMRAMAATTRVGQARRCIVLWMNGGPSQFETFDPKPGTNNGGPTGSIQTNVPGIKISEHLPRMARRMDRLAIVRNVASSEGEHERAQYYLHTGFQVVPAFPRPAIGSVISHEFPESATPKYVLLGGRGFGPAYCGPEHTSFAIESAAEARNLLQQIERRRNDIEFMKDLGRRFDEANNFSNVARRTSMVSQIQRIINTPFRESLNVESESAETHARYGENEFGQRCLLARRLLQRDVPFVEVQLDGWDTHIDNFDQTAQRCAPLDQAWSALSDDLESTGLWDDTLILWMGEFGRTPAINGQNGRDHFPAVTPVVFAGGVIPTGQSIGRTNNVGSEIEGDSYRVADLAATVLHLLGIDPQREFQTSFDSPTTATDNGKVIERLI